MSVSANVIRLGKKKNNIVCSSLSHFDIRPSVARRGRCLLGLTSRKSGGTFGDSIRSGGKGLGALGPRFLSSRVCDACVRWIAEKRRSRASFFLLIFTSMTSGVIVVSAFRCSETGPGALGPRFPLTLTCYACEGDCGETQLAGVVFSALFYPNDVGRAIRQCLPQRWERSAYAESDFSPSSRTPDARMRLIAEKRRSRASTFQFVFDSMASSKVFVSAFRSAGRDPRTRWVHVPTFHLRVARA